MPDPGSPQPDAIPVPAEPEMPSTPPTDFPEIPEPQPPQTPFPVHPEPAPGQAPPTPLYSGLVVVVLSTALLAVSAPQVRAD